MIYSNLPARCFTISLLAFAMTNLVALPSNGQSKEPNQPEPIMYSLGPDSMVQDDVPQGDIIQRQWLESKIFPGTKRRYSIYVPQQYDASKSAALMVFQDGHAYADRSGQYRAAVVMDNLIHRQQMPVAIGVFIDPGHKKDALPDKRGWEPQPENRSVEYDTLSDDYVRFLLEEILPEVRAEYNITDDSAGWVICGASSGGICAFTAAWERPDAFSKVISHIGSFTNIRHGDTYPGIIRKTPAKPIRVYLQDGRNDLDNEHGNWSLGNQQMHKALVFKGYDHKFEFGGGGHNGNHGGAILPDAMRWIWRDYPGVTPLPAALSAEVNAAPWAADWWQDRHDEKLDLKNKMENIDVVMLGDSITHNWESDGASVLASKLVDYDVLNLGFSGDRTEHVLWRLRNGAVQGIAPKVVMVLIGSNNTGHRTEPPAETAAGIAEIIRELRTRLPESKILLQAIFPRDKSPNGKLRKQNDAVNEIIKHFGDDEHVFYADIGEVFLDPKGRISSAIMPDFLHLSREGYQKWADAILPTLETMAN